MCQVNSVLAESSMDTSAEVENTKGTASEPTSAVDKLGKLYISCCIVRLITV